MMTKINKTDVILELYKKCIDDQAEADLWPPVTPTTQWLATAMDVSTSVVNYHLNKLVKSGLMRQAEPNSSYRLTEKAIKKLWPTTKHRDLRSLHPKFLATQARLTGTSTKTEPESELMSSSTKLISSNEE